MPPKRSQFVWVAALAATFAAAKPVGGQIWKQFVPTGHAAKTDDAPARESNRLQAGATPQTAAGDYGLAQESGPWLIVAASFSGDGAEKQANDLAHELHEQFHMRSYVHEMDFKFGDDTNGQGIGNGSPVRRHFRRGNEVREVAVLVGDFPSIDGPDAQQMLSRVKTLEPNALKVDASQSAQSMAEVHRFENSLLEKLGKPRKRGPMGQAFFTRNPLLPQEYFVPKGVDKFVAKMNEGVDHSLLDCPGRQTIQVATFRGKTILQTSTQDDAAAKSLWGSRKKSDQDPLVLAAENAHLLTKELRSHGFEAYEFHDRTESIVTIGSFNQTTQQLPDGRVVAIPDVQRIVQTFDASFDTPADPLTGIGNDSRTQQLVEEQEQQVRMKLNNQQAQVVPGMNPKHVKILNGHGKNARVERIIPMDVHPQIIEAPKRSISSAYSN